MTFERSATPPAEPGPAPVGGGPAATPTPVQIRLQILSTEHWSLLASRSLAWNESFSRAGMYLSTLTGAMVALGLIAGVSGFNDAFFVFALVILPVALFVGVGTWLRMGATNYHDAVTVSGMNRIRGAYLEIAPDLEPYFVMGVHDDAPGIGITMAVPPGTAQLVHLIAGTPTLVMVLNAVVSGATVALALMHFSSAEGGIAVVAALVVAIFALALQLRIARRNIRRLQGTVQPMFPTPPGDRTGA
ncbi:MAG: hypothetical protein H0V73_02450 [Chloroflexi bacterium]|nr:hypothetical protein [Chloroflexota bacterium]